MMMWARYRTSWKRYKTSDQPARSHANPAYPRRANGAGLKYGNGPNAAFGTGRSAMKIAQIRPVPCPPVFASSPADSTDGTGRKTTEISRNDKEVVRGKHIS